MKMVTLTKANRHAQQHQHHHQLSYDDDDVVVDMIVSDGGFLYLFSSYLSNDSKEFPNYNWNLKKS